MLERYADCICSFCTEPQTVLIGDVAEQIKTLRQQNQWTQQELAQRAGMKQESISRMENNRRGHSWSRPTLTRLARAFGKKLIVRFE